MFLDRALDNYIEENYLSEIVNNQDLTQGNGLGMISMFKYVNTVQESTKNTC